MSLISSVDQQAQLLRLPRLLNLELYNAREIVIPEKSRIGSDLEANNHLVFRDHSGALSVVFLDTNSRLVQYSHSRAQLRDLVTGVKEFRVWHSSKNLWTYQLVFESNKESIFGSFQPYSSNF